MTSRVASGRQTGVEEGVRPLAERAADRVDCELVSVRFVNEAGGWVLRIVIDRDGGIDVESCAKVSRQLSAMLDVEDLIEWAYTLEVSSPGLEDELLVAADYRRFAGRQVRIQTSEPVASRTVWRGVLKGLRRGQVALAHDDGLIEIALEQISVAHLETEI